MTGCWARLPVPEAVTDRHVRSLQWSQSCENWTLTSAELHTESVGSSALPLILPKCTEIGSPSHGAGPETTEGD